MLIGTIKFKSCPREANQVAHEIAKFSFLNNQTCNWVDEPPSFILDRLVNDVTVLSQLQVSDALFSLPGYLRGLEGF
jgi:hypothetical protein